MPVRTNNRNQGRKRARRKASQTVTSKIEIKSIWIVDRTFYFYENCFIEWLDNFEKIQLLNKLYKLAYEEDNLDSCLLGQGGNGFVLKYKCNSEEFAIKFFTNKNNRDKEVTRLKEVNTLFSEEKSANFRITRFMDAGEISLNLYSKTYNLFFIIMDLADGTIKNIMCDHFTNHSSDLETSDLLMQIKHLSETIEVLHNANFAHRDIKPENILLKGNLPILADFGLSGNCDVETIRKKGPKYWPNPEFIQTCDRELQKIDLKSDIFNLGCLFFYFFSGKYPIGQIDLNHTLSTLSQEVKDVIISMISYEKEPRLDNISEVISIIDSRISNNSIEPVI